MNTTATTRAEAYAMSLRHSFAFTVSPWVAILVKRSANSRTYLFPDGSKMQIIPGWANVTRAGEGRHYARLPIAMKKAA